MQQMPEHKPRLIEINRQQLILRPTDVEELVSAEHSIRAIWEFTGKLDLGPFHEQILSRGEKAGRPAWDPRLMVSLWLYAYSQGEGSARAIARLCEKDPAYQWLCGMQEINHHTLSNFRSQKKALLEELFQTVLGILAADGLVTLERVMHDGTKIKACASSDTFRREEKVKEFLDLAKKQIEELEKLGDDELSSRHKRARERAAEEKKEKMELALSELEKIRKSKQDQESKEQARVCVTDPECRVMKQGDGGYAPSYNAQISTDSAQGIIVGASVTQSSSDYGQLVPAIDKIKENMEEFPKQMVVDGGFISNENIIRTDEKKVDLIGSLQKSIKQAQATVERQGVSKDFYPEKFYYDGEKDQYECPAGKTLTYDEKHQFPGVTHYRYEADKKDCADCPFKSHCCPKAKRGRTITRVVRAAAVEAFHAKMQTESAKQIYKKRGPIAEFTNAWIKAKIRLRQFHLRGLKKVECEVLWACLTYNVQQWIRIRWRQPVIALATA
jgi:transposase